MLPKMYCLTCSQIPWRNEAVQARFDALGLDVEMFYGVHGATVGIAPTLAHFDSPTHLINAGKLSITISKMLLWTTIIERPEPCALVFENDVVFCDDFHAAFDRCFTHLPTDWEVVHVGHCATEDKPTRFVNCHVAEIKHPFCCHAILWTQRAAKLALAEFNKASWGSPSDIMLAKLVYPRLRHYSFTPGLVHQDATQGEAGSTGRWDQLQGWFDYQHLYDEMLDKVAAPAKFVEVGCWLGRSTAYMAEEIKRRYKPVEFFAVDHWRGNADEPPMAETIAAHHGDLYPQFLRNMSRAGVWDHVKPIRADSVEAAGQFAPRSLDFVFIDADHGTTGVLRDVAAWRSRIKRGGILAGHDIDRESVRRALDQVFPGKYRTWDRCWIVDNVR